MSVKKAIQAIDILLDNKRKVRSGMLDPIKPWNREKNLISSIANDMAMIIERDIDWLQAIKRQLEPEQHRTKIECRHPKKDHDTSAGQKYCMNCNADL